LIIALFSPPSGGLPEASRSAGGDSLKGDIGSFFKNLRFKKIDSFEGFGKIFINLEILLDGICNSLPISA
jgi:hypothetical protein